MSQKNIREFIFLDRDKLYSLYSQVYEGVAEKIVESYSEGYSESSPSSRSEDLDERIAEVTHKTESRVLYDHMFERLTNKISPSITEPDQLSTDNYNDIIEDGSLVKITGKLRVGDYESIKELVERWDEFSNLITGASLVERGITVDQYQTAVDEITKLRQRLLEEDDPNEVARIEAKIQSYGPVLEILTQQEDMFFPESVRGLMKMVLELFYEGQYEANLTRDEDKGVRFRAPLARESLREDHDILRTTYAGDKFGGGWTVLGSVAFIPDQDFGVEDLEIEDLEDVGIDEDPDSLRGGLTGFLKAIDFINRAALQSADTVEIHLTPLAIYREYEVEVADDDDEAVEA